MIITKQLSSIYKFFSIMVHLSGEIPTPYIWNYYSYIYTKWYIYQMMSQLSHMDVLIYIGYIYLHGI